jgi:uncharacterized membrane protein HdeD (DUF308 family)
LLLVYTIAYGVPEVKDPKETMKIVLSTVGLIGVAVGLFAFIRSFGKSNRNTFFINQFIFILTITITITITVYSTHSPSYSYSSKSSTKNNWQQGMARSFKRNPSRSKRKSNYRNFFKES